MPKVFYTEHDIEDMARRGVFSLEVGEDVVLTDLAYEKANRLGVKLMQERAETPPAAPVRPYIVKSQSLPKPPAQAVSTAAAFSAYREAPAVGVKTDAAALRQRIRDAVIARLGAQVDPSLLDTIITRVLSSTGIQ